MEGQAQKVVGDPSLDNLGEGEEITVLAAGEKPPQTPEGAPLVSADGQPVSPQNPNSTVFSQNGPPDNGIPPVEAPPTIPPVQTDEPPVITGEPVVPQTPEGTPPVDPNAPVPPDPAPPVVNTWDTVFNTVKEKTGIEFQSPDQMLSELQEFGNYKKDPNAHLPAEIKAHVDFIHNGGDTSEFYRLKSLDFKSMQDKEVLYQSYLRDNPDHAKDQDFARMYFDKSVFGPNYQILSEAKRTQEAFETDDGEPDQMAYQQYLQNHAFAEKSLSFESNSAREKLVSWQDKATTPPTHPSTGMTKEEATAFNEQYMAGVNQVKSAYKGEEVPISQNVEENLKLGLNDSLTPQWEKDLINPMGIFNEMGLHENGDVDLEKLAKASFVWRIWPKIGPIMSKLILESENRQTVTGQQVNPATSTPSPANAPGQAHGEDEMAEVADLVLEQIRGNNR